MLASPPGVVLRFVQLRRTQSIERHAASRDRDGDNYDHDGDDDDDDVHDDEGGIGW